MAQPTPYIPSTAFIPFTFVGYVPGQQLDIEFNNIKRTLDQILSNLALIQRDDGSLVSTPGTVAFMTATITRGADIGSPYQAPTNAQQILVNKSIGSATYIQMPLAASAVGGVLIKDTNGDAGTHNITVEFTGGELCDGVATIVIGTGRGRVMVNPLPNGGGWFRA